MAVIAPLTSLQVITTFVQLMVPFSSFFQAASVSELAHGQAWQPVGSGAHTSPPEGVEMMQYSVFASHVWGFGGNCLHGTVVAAGADVSEPPSAGAVHPEPPCERLAPAPQWYGFPPTQPSSPHVIFFASPLTVTEHEQDDVELSLDAPPSVPVVGSLPPSLLHAAMGARPTARRERSETR